MAAIVYLFSPQMTTIVFIILQIFFETPAVLKIGEYSPLGNIRSRDVFRPIEREQKYFMDYMNNSHHLARKYVRMFVRGHYLFREANSFPRAKLEEKCELRGTDNVQGQINGIKICITTATNR